MHVILDLCVVPLGIELSVSRFTTTIKLGTRVERQQSVRRQLT